MSVHVVSVCTGTKYDPKCVEILHDMVARNLSLVDVTHWCLTDQAVHPDIKVIEPTLPGWWAKVELFSPRMPWAIGDRILYFDLDVVITGQLEELAARPGIIQDWNWPCYNSSVMVWDHGDHAAIWETFDPTIPTAEGTIVPRWMLPEGQVNGGDQEWITEVSVWETFPRAWCLSQHQVKGWPPTACKVVCFHGATKPHDIKQGWIADVYRVGGFTSLPVMDGANVETEGLLANVRASVARDLPWFTGFGPGKQVAVLVAGGPSMREGLEAIRAHKQRGARIVTVNNAWRFLVENGIKPDTHIMLDARPENAAFIAGAPQATRYLVASQCHPDVFDALEAQGCRVVLWHNAFGDGSQLRDILAPWWDEGPDQRPCCLIPGGGTVGLRALFLAAYSGYRKIHVYGMDSSFSDDGEHHAYPQALNDADKPMTVVLGEKSYRAAVWMVRQAEEFKWHWRDLKAMGLRLFVHGRGLIPDIAKRLEAGDV